MSPDAFASHHQVIVTNAPGSGNNPDCGSNCFIPNIVTIPPGGTVTWENTDTAAHTATSGTTSDGPDGVWDSSLMMVGGSFSYTADTVGTYHYFCMVHPWMLGTVIVTDQGGVVPDSGEKTTSAYGTVETEKSQYELRSGQSMYVKIFGTVENPGSSTEKVYIELTKPNGGKLSMSITKTSQGYYETVMPVNHDNLGEYRVDVTFGNNHVGSMTFSVVDKNQAKKDRAEEAAKAEQARIEQARIEQARIEQERIEQERIEQERIEQERIEQERIEQERIEQERIEQERIEQERIEQESTGNQSSLASSPIKKGMWIQYQVGINFDFPEVYYRASNEAMELTMLQAFYGIQHYPGESLSGIKYAVYNVAGIKAEITDVIGNSCVTDAYLVMKDGSQELWLGSPGGGTEFCDEAKENRSLKIGDDLLDRDVLFYSPAEGPMEFPSSMEVKEFSTVTINGKKIDVIVANGKEITYHSSGKSEVEVEVLIHRYTGLIIGLSFSGSASAGNERGTFSFSFFANDVSEHFTEKPILGAISQPISSIVSEPLYIIIGVVAIGGVIGAIAVAKRGSKTPKPAKQELDEYEKEYLVKQKPSRKPAEKKETSMFCTNCGAAFKKSEARFCGECGTPRS